MSPASQSSMIFQNMFIEHPTRPKMETHYCSSSNTNISTCLTSFYVNANIIALNPTPPLLSQRVRANLRLSTLGDGTPLLACFRLDLKTKIALHRK